MRRGMEWTMLCLALAALTPTRSATAANVWKPTSGTNAWYGDANNWSQGHFPLAGEDVVITNKGVGVRLASPAPASGWLGSFAISNTATLIFTNWNTTLSAAEVGVHKGAIVTCAGPFTNAPAMSNRVWIVCTNLTVTGGGRIHADYLGYAGSTNSNRRASGPRGGYGGSGGAHGGFGGISFGDPRDAVSPCGDPVHPEAPGSGGGSEAVSGARGGAGGGAIRIEAAMHVLVNGLISANGQTRVIGQAGGGAGGSIYINCHTIGGTNTIQANGGGHQVWGAPGAGGRIAVHYNPTAQKNAPASALKFSVLPGPLDIAYGSGYSVQLADIGTVYFPDGSLLTEPMNVSGQIILDAPAWATDRLTLNGKWVRFPQEGFRCTVSNDVIIRKVSGVGRLEMGASTLTNFSIGTTGGYWNGYRFFGTTTPCELNVGGNLILTNGGSLMVYSVPTNSAGPYCGAVVKVGGEMRVHVGCWVYPYSHWSNGGSPVFRLQSLTIATNAGFNADYAGYAGGGLANASVGYNGFGPGGGWKAAPSYETIGGSYGGLGGRALAGKTYGSSNAPALPGSGGQGGLGGGLMGGFGGGSIRLAVSNKVTLAGTLRAVGGKNSATYDAGGSGGGIYLTCRTFKGSATGILRADGGAGYIAASGGGGGRIAVWRMFDQSSGSVSNSVAGAGNGQLGSFVMDWILPVRGTVITVH